MTFQEYTTFCNHPFVILFSFFIKNQAKLKIGEHFIFSSDVLRFFIHKCYKQLGGFYPFIYCLQKLSQSGASLSNRFPSSHKQRIMEGFQSQIIVSIFYHCFKQKGLGFILLVSLKTSKKLVYFLLFGGRTRNGKRSVMENL